MKSTAISVIALQRLTLSWCVKKRVSYPDSAEPSTALVIHTMRRIQTILLIMVAVLLPIQGVAQSVSRTENGALIDCSGAHTDLYTRIKKARTTDATDNTMGTNTMRNVSSIASNYQIYYALEVYKEDNQVGVNWSSAVRLCAKLKTDGGSWRVPTQRELMLIWMLNDELTKVGQLTELGDFYWCATESGITSSWVVSFPRGATSINNKSNKNRVRCVRDSHPKL